MVPPRETRTGAAKEGTYRRRLAVLVYVLERGFASISELASEFNCHPNSIRGDIQDLTRRGSLVYFLPPDLLVSLVPTFSNEALVRRLGTNLEEKICVAKKALEFIEDRDCVYLSGGATNFLLALEIARSNRRGVTALTGTLYTQHFLKRVDQARILAGRVARHSAVIECEVDLPTMKKCHINKSFLGVDALSWEHGAFCVRPNVEVQRSACLAARDLAVFLTDHAEVGEVLPEGQFVLFQELEKKGLPYVVICNKQIPDSQRQERVHEELGKFPTERIVWA